MTMTEQRTGDELAEAGLDPPKPQSTEIERRTASTDVDLDLDSWQVIMAQAEAVAGSGIVPVSYRGKPDDVVAAYLTGREFGWGMMTSLRYIFVIDGKPSFSAEAILGMIHRAGHRVEGTSTAESATITGTRRDTGATLTVEYPLADAVAAGLVQIRDGKPFARSAQGNKKPWEKYTSDMLWARCVSRIARRLFSDVVLGAGYVPDEFDGPAFVDPVNGPETASAGGPPAPPVVTADIIRERYALLPQEARAKIDDWMAKGEAKGYPGTIEALSNDDHPALLDQVLAVLDRAIGELGVEPFDVDSSTSTEATKPVVEDVTGDQVEVLDAADQPTPEPATETIADVVDVDAIEESIEGKVAAAKAKQAAKAAADKAEDDRIRSQLEVDPEPF